MGEQKIKKYAVQVKDVGNSEVEITGEIVAEEFESHRARAIKELGNHVEIPGFRKGHIPESVLLQKVGEGAVLQETAEHALRGAYPTIVSENNIDAIGYPEITITKIARGNPLGFKIKTAVMPKIGLPDYVSFAKKIPEAGAPELEPTDAEVNSMILEIRKNWAKMQKKSASSPDVSSDEKKSDESADETLPDFNEEFVKKLGAFETVDAFKQKVKENLGEEKKMRAKEKRRLEIIEAVLKSATIAPPKVLIESELEKMLGEFKGNISGMGLKPEEYFQKLGKSEEDMKKEWGADAEKRVKTQLVLHEIGLKEKINIDEAKLEEETKRLLEYHKGADPARARNYIAGLMMNEAVFQFLEKSEVKNEEQKPLTG